eukprot:3020517-Rhodomonas_salina.2
MLCLALTNNQDVTPRNVPDTLHELPHASEFKPMLDHVREVHSVSQLSFRLPKQPVTPGPRLLPVWQQLALPRHSTSRQCSVSICL